VSALRQQSLRFLIVGGSNTLVTFVLLAILAQVIDHRIAYTIVFAAGIAYTTALTGRFVFSAQGSRSKTLAFVLWYVSVYLVGLFVVYLVDSNGEHSGLVVAVATVLVTAPLGFLGGRVIYHRASPVGDRQNDVVSHAARDDRAQ
jgi:putative flippase GtrA